MRRGLPLGRRPPWKEKTVESSSVTGTAARRRSRTGRAPEGLRRGSGVLLHPTSLPGPYGSGDLGPSAERFLDFLAAAGQTYWQVLPLGPTGYGDSPYQTFSAFAGNPLLISPELLGEEGLLPAGVLDDSPTFPAGQVDYGAAGAWKCRILALAFDRLRGHGSAGLREELQAFVAANADWLEPFALFMALKDAHDGRPWPAWDSDIAAREPEALARWSARLESQARGHAFNQFLFFRQWQRLKAAATAKGIRIIGDAPIYVAHDSADCWVNRRLFHLRPDGSPALVAGVPPDYFSATGQLWGNPLYRWDILAEEGYQWWIDRLRMALSTVDVLRLDHFRGFAGYWAIPGEAATAETGTWEPGPGAPLFTALTRALDHLPLIAEDLGVITPDVVALRDRFHFPGMRVLQFAFDSFEAGPGNPHLPHNHVPNSVVYTGTHDNDTTAGWYRTASRRDRAFATAYARSSRKDPATVAWDIIRLAQASVARVAVAPLQDLLSLGSAARMNRPGQLGGNWQWRYEAEALTDELAARLAALTRLYGRAPEASQSSAEA
jgi:4-alpha-glucanotransferase